MKKFTDFITNWRALALTALAVAALLCLFSTSEWTAAIIITKAVGLCLAWAFFRLFDKWEGEGRLDILGLLFNDDGEEGEPW